jgi:predicted ATPase/DNA-binding SARP family transcriptional activator
MKTVVHLLGGPRWERDGLFGALPHEGPLWLIAFLSGHEEPVAREELLELLYPDTDSDATRNRLRGLLHRARSLPWTAGLEADARGVRWNADCDVRRFRRAVTQGRWAEAVRVYGGTFLEGCRVYDSPELEGWLESERENLKAAWTDAVLNYAAFLQGAGAHTEALPLLERALEFDPYAEEAVRGYLRSAAGSGQTRLAENVYSAFRTRLERDLGLEPEPATVRLFESLLESVTPGPPASLEPTRSASPGRALRNPLTSFVGREAELEAVARQLIQPECRVLTLCGPGGMGKTRLALEIVEAHRVAFEGEVSFVPLEAVNSGQALVFAVAGALGLDLSGAHESRQRLLEFLRERSRLIVLDNFEQLLTPAVRPDALAFVLDVLEATTGVKLLVTSRHRLELQAEWVVPLEGLDAPTSGTLEAARRSSAARLFVERASRARPGFALSLTNAPAIARICRLTDGLPLGLELAAAWAGVLEPHEIAAELEVHADLDGLDTAADRPPRHHSLRAAFEHSWDLLSGQERDALARLSVFRGGFERAGATRVAGASLRSLLGLMNKSLLRRALDGRFNMLEVIRQHAAERLRQTPEQEAATRRAHAEYTLELLEQTEPALRGPDQSLALERINLEHDNARAALDWAVETAQADAALRLTAALHWFWSVRGHHREGRNGLEVALALTGTNGPARARALYGAGWLSRELGDYASAHTHLEDALRLAQAHRDRTMEAAAIHALGLIHRETGDLGTAWAEFEQSAAIQRELRDHWGLATSLNDLGVVALLREDFSQARRFFEESLRLKETIGDAQGVAYALTNLGQASTNPTERRDLTERSLAIKRELGDHQGVANGLYNLGALDLETGDLESARTRLTESLNLFWQLGRRRAIAAALASFAQLFALQGRFENSAHLMGAVDALVNAAGFQLQGVNTDDLERDLRLTRDALGDAAYARAHQRGQTMTLQDAISLARN